MKVRDLFDVKYGVNLELNACEITTDMTGINFVSRTSENNGVVARVKLIPNKIPQPAGVITCAAGGSVLSSFVQNEPFYSGRDLYILTPKTDMSLEEKLFYCKALKMNAYRYQYGRQANKTLKDINLPKLPEWIKKYKIDYTPIHTKIKTKPDSLDTSGWKRFKISDLFEVKGTQTTKLDDLILSGRGKYPYITTQSVNNGVAGYYNLFTEEGNVLTADSAVVGFCSYQEQNFSASDHVEKLVPKFKMNKYIALFLTTVINLENYRYNYGRKFNHTKIKQTVVRLPAKQKVNEKEEPLFEQKQENGVLVNDLEKPLFEPDWEFMEKYVKSLPYSDLI